MTWRSWPGPLAFFAAFALAVPVPLLGYAATHRVEDILSEGPAVGWWVVAAIALLAASARRWVAGLAAGAVFGLAAAAFYHWVVPEDGPPIVAAVVALLIGAAVGEALGRRQWRKSGPLPRMILGGVLALAGASLATDSVRQGAEYHLTVHPGDLAELAAGQRYAVYAQMSPMTRPECRITGPDGRARTVELLPTQPESPGYDATPGSRWIGTVESGPAGRYTLGCTGGAPALSYTLGGVPEVDGAVASLLHWPRPILWLLGALPGLVLIGQGARQALRSRRKPARLLDRRSDREGA